MTLDGRDRAIVQHVARFGQLSSTHIFDLLFDGSASRTPCDRSLRRLTVDKYLARIERRIVGGSRGGSGQYVYQLGREGHALYRTGRYMPGRAVNYHSLAIVEAYIELRRKERAGQFKIAGITTEPDCWVTIGRYELKPDLYVELAIAGGAIRKYWFEIDMGTEGQRQLKDKFQRYWQAFNAADPDEWSVFPLVLFIGTDAERAAELAWLLQQGPAEAQTIFRIASPDSYAHMVL